MAIRSTAVCSQGGAISHDRIPLRAHSAARSRSYAWRNRSADRLSAVMLAAFAFYLVFSLFNTTLLTSRNILMLAVPAGIIMRRDAELRVRSEEAMLDRDGLLLSSFSEARTV